MIKRSVWLFLVMAMIIAPLSSARAETYEKPALMNLFKTLIRFNAVDINDDDIVDLYGRTNECEVYKKNYADVFKWEKIRSILRKQIREDVATYPTGYRYDTALKLDRYDFKKKIYPFSNMSRQQNVNTFTMQVSLSDYCIPHDLKGFPTIYKLVLGSPVVIEGLPLDEKQGEELFYRMNAEGNTTHIVYASFNIRVVYIASLATAEEFKQIKTNPAGVAKVRQDIQLDTAVIDSRLDSIDYYEDEARTRLIYRYRP